ncbi:unnamed protein product [Schistosoma margrebowiei]|uniref:Uncharacterized protein n=1 Tax=Schistosoma margrebowiei TaxID=48269 RepID=A0A183NAX0_9TREM|nr:unnamed protein product [Schistosoma margrebowiei]
MYTPNKESVHQLSLGWPHLLKRHTYSHKNDTGVAHRICFCSVSTSDKPKHCQKQFLNCIWNKTEARHTCF